MPVYKAKRSLWRKVFNRKNAMVIVLAGLIMVQFFQVSSVKSSMSSLESRDSSLITEIGQLKQSSLDFNDNINEVRNFFGLPTMEVSFEEPEGGEPGTEDKNEDKVQLAMFKYFDHLGSTRDLQIEVDEKRGFLENLAESEAFGSFLQTNVLTAGSVSESDEAVSLEINTEEGDNLVFYYLDKSDGALVVRTANDKQDVESSSSDIFIRDAKSFIEANKGSLVKFMTDLKAGKELITSVVATEEIQNFLNEKGVTIAGEPVEENLESTYVIENSSEEEIGAIVFDHQSLDINLVNIDYPETPKALKTLSATNLLPFLETLNTAGFIEKKVTEMKEAIGNTLMDAGFKLVLQENGLKMAETVREDEDRFYFDIFDLENNHLSSIVLEKATAVINIAEPDGSSGENLLFFDPEVKKKTLEIPEDIPKYGEELSHEDDTFNILIAGKHGNLVDTMIFAHINETKKTVRMISVPRDLQWNGRKINSFPHYYGMPELKKVLSDMTGYELDKFILIDMYAFIDVIDLIGGIDITLEHAVIDPTYRTEDNGVVGTLHYEPGDYHLGGKESLRLARSRHTSSDFARAARQQLILKALQDKAKNFGFGDADTLFEIAKTVLGKTETDVSIDEAIVYYFKYQNYDIQSNDVMSSGNVLYAPPYITMAQCQGMMAAAAAADQPDPGCAGQNHAYILIPRNNNWNVIKWFFQEKFEGV